MQLKLDLSKSKKVPFNLRAEHWFIHDGKINQDVLGSLVPVLANEGCDWWERFGPVERLGTAKLFAADVAEYLDGVLHEI